MLFFQFLTPSFFKNGVINWKPCEGMGGVLPNSKEIYKFIHLEKFPRRLSHKTFVLPHQRFIPPPSIKLQFSCHNPIKNFIFIALFIALALSVRLILILINVEYCQNVFLRCLHGQNHSSSWSHHTMKEIFSSFPKNLTFNEDLPEKMNSQIWLYIYLLLWPHYLINFSKLV